MKLLESIPQANRPMSADQSSSIIDLKGCPNYALQAAYVAPGSAKTFDSNVQATLVVADLTWTAVAAGTAGNSVSVALTAGATAGAEVVTVVGNAITIQIADGVSTATQVKAKYDAKAAAIALATLAITGTASNAQAAAASAPLAGGVDSEIDLVNDVLSVPAHGMHTGQKVQVTTTGTRPTGIAATTDYWVIALTANTLALATSLANADAGTRLNITGQGVGVQTITATAGTLAHSLQLQKSVDGTNWYSEGSAVTVSAAGSNLWEGAAKGYRFLRFTNTVTTGQAVYSMVLNANG